MKVKKNVARKLADQARFQALLILDQVENHGGYSNVLLDRFHQETSLSPVDTNLVVKLVYGVIQRRYSLDYFLAPFIKGKKVDDWVGSLLRLSIYQFIYLDRIPDHAVFSQAVEMAKLIGHAGLGGFVNGVLRNFQRRADLDLNKLENPLQALAVKYSIAPWIIKELQHQISEADLEALLGSLLEEPYVSARIVKSGLNSQAAREQLSEEGLTSQASPISPVGLRFESGNPVHSSLFQQGALTIQDESSQLVASLGKLQAGMTVLDACAAPGGKATHIAQILRDLGGGKLQALDISSAKLTKVDDHLQRLGLSQFVSLQVEDASKFIPTDGKLYDRIYLDAPCSGLGLMRRKPEIKYSKQANHIQALAEIQAELLNHTSSLLKPGGYLIYSTCTLASQENEEQVGAFLQEHEDFELDQIIADEVMAAGLINDQGMIRIWPHQYHTDGFFIARLKKIK